ncbi:MAG: hypothetical protein K2Y17_07880, partial [Qipengyuania sp.]|nr:hypothetical protein [Qipengyuania sp.]
MMTRTLLARCAPLAIAAPAAFPFVPVAAQDTIAAEPVIVIPEPVPAAESATPPPAIALPDPVAEPAPVVAAQAEPVAAPRAAADAIEWGTR